MNYLKLLLTLPLVFVGCSLYNEQSVDYSLQDERTYASSSNEYYSVNESSFDFDNAYEVSESDRCFKGEEFEVHSAYNFKENKWYCPDTTEYNYRVEKEYTAGDTVYTVGFCNTDDLKSNEYIRNSEVYTPYLEYLALIKNVPAVTPNNLGYTLIHGKWKLVNEVNEGIHVYDNTDSQNSIYTTFISIPGNNDFVIKNNILLANSYEVLLAIDFTTPTAVTLLKDIPEILISEDYKGEMVVSKERGLVTEMIEVKTTEVYCRNGLRYANNNESSYGREENSSDDYYYAMSNNSMTSESTWPYYDTSADVNNFVLGDDYLYVLKQGVLVTIDVEDETSPKYLSQNEVNKWSITSINNSNGVLFLAGDREIQLVDISKPSNPRIRDPLIGITRCDEIIAVEDYIYAGRTRNKNCDNRENSLLIVNISDKSEPVIEEVYSMGGPSDIEIVDGYLYVCDGRAGFKIYAVEGAELDLIAQIDSIVVETVSIAGLVATLSGEGGVYTYDLSDVNNPVEISFTPTE
ncbi:MAG: hypothetical protein OCC49_05245 [Fibrobacterales bacterium]